MTDEPLRRRSAAGPRAATAPRRPDTHRAAPQRPAPQRAAAPPRRTGVGGPWHLAVVAAWGAAWATSLAGGTAFAWHFCVQGALLITRGGGAAPGSHWPKPGGLHLYANYPDLQMGPLTFWTASVLRRTGGHDGTVGAQIVMALLGLVVLVAVERAVRHTRPALDPARVRTMMLLAGLVLTPFWIELAVRFAHLDDVLALTFTALAVWAVAAGRGAAAGLALGAAADSKPWAAAFLVVVLALPRTQRIPAAVAAVLALGVAWLPFAVADPHTLSAAGFSMPIAPTSGLRMLGLGGGRTPGWDRAAQVVLGAALAWAVGRRGRWAAVPLVAVAVRVALDPNTFSYYTTGLVVAAVFWDCVGSSRTVPLWTLSLPLVLNFDRISGASALFQSQIRFALAVAVAALLAFAERPDRADQSDRAEAAAGLEPERPDSEPGPVPAHHPEAEPDGVAEPDRLPWADTAYHRGSTPA